MTINFSRKGVRDVRRGIAMMVLTAIALLCAPGAQAACYLNWNFATKQIRMDMGTVIIPNDAPVGAVFKTQSFTIPIAGDREVAGRCNGGSVRGYMLQGTPVSGMANVYTSTVSGVGIRLSREIGGLGKVYYPHVMSYAGRRGPLVWYRPSYFTVELIKTASQTGNGPLAAGVYTTYVTDGDGRSALTSYLSGYGITIVTPSCTVDAGSKNVLVNFGSVARKSFNGVGSTAGDHSFNIKLNCKRGVNMQNTILLKMQATADPSGSPGVTRLTQGVGVATGVGIQMLDKSSKPVVFGAATKVGPSADIQYVVPYTARYYQTAANMTPGKANGTATFTIEYQ